MYSKGALKVDSISCLCVQLRAPGCPVIIVGTHLDAMKDDTKVKDLEIKAMKRYSLSPNYPKVCTVDNPFFLVDFLVCTVDFPCVRTFYSNIPFEMFYGLCVQFQCTPMYVWPCTNHERKQNVQTQWRKSTVRMYVHMPLTWTAEMGPPLTV